MPHPELTPIGALWHWEILLVTYLSDITFVFVRCIRLWVKCRPHHQKQTIVTQLNDIGSYSCPEQVISQLRGVSCHYGIIQCYLPPDTSEDTPTNPSPQTGRYAINITYSCGLSWPRWFGTYLDGLPASRHSPIQVVTGPDVEQLSWLRSTW